MSARLLTSDEAAKAELVRWPSVAVDTHERFAPVIAAPGAETVQSDFKDQVATLQLQLERLKADSEKQVAEARSAGRREGEESAREALAVNVNAELERMKQLTREVLASAPLLRKQAEADLVRLAVAIARRILHRELAVDSEALLGLTKASLSKIDQREIQVIRTHPDNVSLVQRVLDQSRMQKKIEISADARLDRGALVIETARGQLDASVETHLDEIERGFTDLVGSEG
jgi:flagellar assembly protein FliH